MTCPWPEMYFVAEWMTMEAPHSMGLQSAGEAKVLSTMRGMPCSLAISASPSSGATFRPGLPMVSVMMQRVSGFTAARTASRSSVSTMVFDTPIREKKFRRRVRVPP